MNEPILVAYGVGRDSTAMLIEMQRRSIRPDAILFANTGGEKRATYDFLPVMNRWLARHDFPEVTVVNYTPKTAPYTTLEGNMVLNATLPGAAFNKHSCAMKFKVDPQNKWTRSWRPAREAWARGGKVRKFIGFEAGETHRLKRADARAHSGKASAKTDAARYRFEMPLMDWGYDLAACIRIITDAGLPVPPKSACYFCPFQQTHEVDSATPEDRARTILMELTAEPYNTAVRGLWRKPRLADGRPGSITEYILQKRLDFVPLSEIAPVVVLNDKCQKARTGVTLAGPHVGPTLREQLTSAGHYVPEVVTREAWDGAGAPYVESRREVPAWIEYEAHAALVDAM
jgi:hypothetical protein